MAYSFCNGLSSALNIVFWLSFLTAIISEASLAGRLLAAGLDRRRLPIGTIILCAWTWGWACHSLHRSWVLVAKPHLAATRHGISLVGHALTFFPWMVFAGVLTGLKGASCSPEEHSYCALKRAHIALAWIIPCLDALTFFFALDIFAIVTLWSFLEVVIPQRFFLYFRASVVHYRARFRWWRATRATRIAHHVAELRDKFPGNFHCGICQENRHTATSARFAPCRHAFCRECARDYVRSQLADRRLPVLCPQCMTESDRPSNAIGALDSRLVSRIQLSASDNAALSELELRKFSVPVDCPSCARSSYIDKRQFDDAKIVTCPLPGCVHTWCKLCEWRTDSDEPEDRQHTCEGVIELNELMHDHGWKYCPGCKTPTERTAGCDHMTCGTPGCNTHFCYPCGQAVPANGFSIHYPRCPVKPQ